MSPGVLNRGVVPTRIYLRVRDQVTKMIKCHPQIGVPSDVDTQGWRRRVATETERRVRLMGYSLPQLNVWPDGLTPEQDRRDELAEIAESWLGRKYL